MTDPPTPEQLDRLQRQRALESINNHLERQADAIEHWNQSFNVDPNVDQYLDGTTYGASLHGMGGDLRGRGSSNLIDTNPASDDIRLSHIQCAARIRYQENPWSRNIVNNRVTYIGGAGHSYKFSDDTDSDDDEGPASRVKAGIEGWMDSVAWECRQQERARRNERDGEAFTLLKRPPDPAGEVADDTEKPPIQLRSLEPDRFVTPDETVITQLLQDNPDLLPQRPDGNTSDDEFMDYSFGIVTEDGDHEEVIGYVVDGQEKETARFVPASDIVHSKRNVDCGTKRGLPTDYAVRVFLDRAWGTAKNVANVSKFQSDIGVILKALSASSGDVKAMMSNLEGGKKSQKDAKSSLKKDPEQVGVMGASGNVEPIFPKTGSSIKDHLEGVQFDIRSAAAGAQMPEFLVASDASNANFSSTLVAEGPAHKSFMALQGTHIREDMQIIGHVGEYLITTGAFSKEDWDATTITADPPIIQTREPEIEADTEATLTELRASSPDQVCARFDRNPEQLHEERLRDLDRRIEEAKKERELMEILTPDPEPGDDGNDNNTGGDDDE